jgi:hypothetical protein
MDQPKTPQLETLMATVAEMRQMQERLKELKERTSTEAHALYEIADRNLRLQSAAYAYWYAPEVNAKDLTFGAIRQTHPSKLMKLIGSQTSNISCDRCGTKLEITSRAAMADLQSGGGARFPEGFRVICPDCREAIFAARHVEYERRDKEVARRMAELSALPYAHYLETEEWKERLSAFLGFYLHEHSDFVCETCEAEADLGVFHTSLDGLGFHDHLILLCATCISALKDAGRAVGEPGPANRVSPLVLRDLKLVFDLERGG